jgi:hypothetical protein
VYWYEVYLFYCGTVLGSTNQLNILTFLEESVDKFEAMSLGKKTLTGILCYSFSRRYVPLFGLRQRII